MTLHEILCTVFAVIMLTLQGILLARHLRLRLPPNDDDDPPLSAPPPPSTPEFELIMAASFGEVPHNQW